MNPLWKFWMMVYLREKLEEYVQCVIVVLFEVGKES